VFTRDQCALVGRYRAVAPAAAPILSSDTRRGIRGIRAYRMPATHAAMARILCDEGRRDPLVTRAVLTELPI